MLCHVVPCYVMLCNVVHRRVTSCPFMSHDITSPIEANTFKQCCGFLKWNTPKKTKSLVLFVFIMGNPMVLGYPIV